MNEARPAVTVIVPCRNERQHIQACLHSILAQTAVPGGFEVIVVDGMSDDGTREVLQQFPSVRVVANPRQTTPCALNAGIRVARGRFVARMDAHHRYAPDYLERSLAVLERTGADNVGGAMFCEAIGRLPEAIAAAHHSPFSAGGARWHNPGYEGPADTVFGGVYRREVFDHVGLFDEELTRNQDDEFNLRLCRAGGKIWQSPEIQCWYRPRASLAALFQQYLQFGYWKVRVIQKHRRPAAVRQLVPAGFVALLALLPILALVWRTAGGMWAVLVGAYLAGNVTASVLTARRHQWRLLPVLPAVFACYHFGYGLGFLRGLWDFVISRHAPAPLFTRLTRVTPTR